MNLDAGTSGIGSLQVDGRSLRLEDVDGAVTILDVRGQSQAGGQFLLQQAVQGVAAVRCGGGGD